MPCVAALDSPGIKRVPARLARWAGTNRKRPQRLPSFLPRRIIFPSLKFAIFISLKTCLRGLARGTPQEYTLASPQLPSLLCPQKAPPALGSQQFVRPDSRPVCISHLGSHRTASRSRDPIFLQDASTCKSTPSRYATRYHHVRRSSPFKRRRIDSDTPVAVARLYYRPSLCFSFSFSAYRHAACSGATHSRALPPLHMLEADVAFKATQSSPSLLYPAFCPLLGPRRC